MESLLLFFVILLGQLFSDDLTTHDEALNKSVGRTAQVVRVIDGDTILVEFPGGEQEKVRYIGVDTPEIGDKGSECFANEAEIYNKTLVEGRSVILVSDIRERDDYDRLLRYVYVDDIFVQKELVERGYAKVIAVGDDTKHYRELKSIQTKAQRTERGLWGACQKR